MVYYNEHDRRAAAWLRELIKLGHIAAGDVDERSIEDVFPSDLNSYTQCHFFAGIGGWSLALRMAGWPDGRMAGWPDGRQVWTGSCPCQPFSAAGKGAGTADERHLWPAFHWLISQCHPAIVFGEQVASRAGRDWFAVVRADLENLGYGVGAADLCAAGVGAPHIRQRLYFVADADSAGLGQGSERCPALGHGPTARSDCGTGIVGHAIVEGLERHAGDGAGSLRHQREIQEPDRPVAAAGLPHWAARDWLPCRDGKARPIEPGTFPLAHGIPARVGRLRGYGNAIVPQVAAEFIVASRAEGVGL